MSSDFMIDMDADRQARADKRGIQATDFPLRFGGSEIARVPTELPLDVLAPLRRLDEEITLILHSVMQVWGTEDAAQRFDAQRLIANVLMANPKLPTTVLDVLRDMAINLFGEDGYARLMAQRPTQHDLVFLGSRLLAAYGMTLGESQPSDTSSSTEEPDGGTTSPLTSSTTTDETSETSGETPETPSSSESAAF